MEIKTGDPVILVDASNIDGLEDGTHGWANSVVIIPADDTYVFFMAEDGKGQTVLSASRLVVDEEAKAAGLELNENTIYKGD